MYVIKTKLIHIDSMLVCVEQEKERNEKIKRIASSLKIINLSVYGNVRDSLVLKEIKFSFLGYISNLLKGNYGECS